MSDFYEDAARQRYATLEAAKARVLADLAESKATGNDIAAAEELQTLATLNDQIASLNRLHQQYQQQQNPPSPVPETDQEWMSKSAEKMNYDDVARMASKSKYGFDDGAFRAGISEVARRRARGE